MAIGGKILIDCLLAHGAKRGFGIPGESYLAVLDALYDKKEDFNLVTLSDFLTSSSEAPK